MHASLDQVVCQGWVSVLLVSLRRCFEFWRSDHPIDLNAYYRNRQSDFPRRLFPMASSSCRRWADLLDDEDYIVIDWDVKNVNI